MSLFASARKTLAEERVLMQELESLLGAVDVTGLNSFERAKKVYGGLEAAVPRVGKESAQVAETGRSSYRSKRCCFYIDKTSQG